MSYDIIFVIVVAIIGLILTGIKLYQTGWNQGWDDCSDYQTALEKEREKYNLDENNEGA